ncbi:glycosyltransferase family 2 protein [Mycobacterium sp. 3519A]|uniref:glycosyltransferase n=1 Tax=Mycobacterium sp. 3519A TaxID=2057184 RepID=UPI000C79F0FF|nr:glycosyltransferase [Mycobacterium sp. 3519A]
MPIVELAEQFPTVSVVIPTAGGRSRLIDRAISRLLADPATAELIIVFDRPDAATEHVVQSYADRDTRVLSTCTIRYDRAGHRNGVQDDDHGQIARNEGVRLASSEIVLTLDDDVEPEAGMVSGHARHHAERKDLVVLGYMPVIPLPPSRFTPQATVQIYAKNYERACARYRADPDAVLLGLWGGNCSVTRRSWLAAAALPRTSAGYHDDRDFGMRLREVGLAGIFDPTLRSWHWYRRSVWHASADAYNAGLGRAALYQAYPRLRELDKVPPPRRALRPLLWAARSGTAWAAMRFGLSGVALAAAAVHWRPIEEAAVRAMLRVGTARGLYQGGERVL